MIYQFVSLQIRINKILLCWRIQVEYWDKYIKRTIVTIETLGNLDSGTYEINSIEN